MGYSPGGLKELDTTERLSLFLFQKVDRKSKGRINATRAQGHSTGPQPSVVAAPKGAT